MVLLCSRSDAEVGAVVPSRGMRMVQSAVFGVDRERSRRMEVGGSSSSGE